jgi:hypothetical protein
MADKKISALTAASTPLAGTEVLPIVQSGATVKVAVSDLTAGRAISATAVTASTGNFVVGTSGQGVDFSATPGTGTSELLADYEEGTWTPGFDGGVTTYGTRGGTYTKVGRLVTATFFINVTTASGTGASALNITGLPFANIQDYAAPSFSYFDNLSYSVIFGLCANGSTTMQLRGSNLPATAPSIIIQSSILSGLLMAGSITYQTS